MEYLKKNEACYETFLLFPTWTLLASWLGWCFRLQVLQSCIPLSSRQSDHGVENIGVSDPRLNANQT